MTSSTHACQGESALKRSAIYGLLAALYRQEISAGLLDRIKDPRFAGVLSELGATEMHDSIQEPADRLLDDLALEYTRLFLGPGKHISPHESVHLPRDDGDWGKLWGAATVEVKKFIEATGLTYDDSFSGMPDHIAAELEFMQQITQAEAEACQRKDDEQATQLQSIQKQFLEVHLGRFAPLFCQKVRKSAEIAFYRELAALTEAFVAYDSEAVAEEEQTIH